MLDHQLQELRREKWRLDGQGVRTLDAARSFISSVGFCTLYPQKPAVLAPTFVGAYIGSDEKLPTAQKAFADPRAKEAKHLMVRLLRDKAAYEALVYPENNFLVSAAVFPFFYGLVGDRNPRQAPVATTRSGYSPLAVDAFRLIQKNGPISKQRLLQSLGKAITEAALDRALDELWAKLRITRVDYKQDEGIFWDVLFRWAPDAVREGMHVSVAEALTALVSKYVDCVCAVPQEEVENFFSPLIGRARVREAINALQAARELGFVHVGGKVMLESGAARVSRSAPQLDSRPSPQAATPAIRRGKPLVERRSRAAKALPPPRREKRRPMSEGRPLIIAIDGPAGSGKSTIAGRLAEKLGYMNLESGAMYRALARKALQQQISLDDPIALRRLADETVIELEPLPDGNRVLLDGQDVSQRIREADVTLAASRVSVHTPVREVMVQRQREMGARGGVVMEGRDIGTAVFPNADVKIFLDADARIRAERRVAQNGSHTPEEAQRIVEELVDRDRRDRTRAVSPLVPAPDAVILDSTNLSIDEVVDRVEQIVLSRLATRHDSG